MVRAVVRAGSSWAPPAGPANEDKLIGELFALAASERDDVIFDGVLNAIIALSVTSGQSAYQQPGRPLFIEALKKKLEAARKEKNKKPKVAKQ